jgi:broad specificity phosphatase PhoE
MYLRVLFAFVLALLLAPLSLAAPDLVILVRHAEKAASPADNPSLTPAGRARAAELARVVAVLSAKAPLQAIFSTSFRRTRETAAPLSKATGVAVTTADDPTAQVLAIQHGTVVIVGHSDTVPALIKAMGGPSGIVIADTQFSNLYVLSGAGSAQAKLAALRYGK